MQFIRKQIHTLYAISALGSFQIAGASWVALLAARGFSLAQIGIAEGVFHGASFLFELPSGVIADVFGRKRAMLLSQGMFLLAAVLMIFSRGMAGVCLSLVFAAWGYNFASGTREALAYDTLKSGGQESAYLAYSATEYAIYRAGNACATLCAGLALALGYRGAYGIDLALTGLCLLCCFRLEEVAGERQLAGPMGRRLRRCFGESLGFLRRNGGAVALMLWNALVGSIATLTAFFLQARLTRVGLSPLWLGPGLFLVSLGGAAGAKLAPVTKTWGYGRLSVVCALGVALGLGLSLGKLPWGMVLGGFLGNLCDDLLQVRTDAALNDRFPSSQRATLVSVSSLCFSVVMMLLSPVMGWLLG